MQRFQGSGNGASHDESVSIRGDGSSPEEIRMGIVHDWLPVYAGAERVLEQMISVFPDSALYSLIDFVPEEQRDFLKGKDVSTSFIQRLPFARSKYRYYLPLAPLAIEQFNLEDHNVVLSSSYAVAKGVLTRADQLHISYVHSPVRYAWDLQFQYLRQKGLDSGFRSAIARLILHYLRLFDNVSSDRVDVYLANSKHVARRIWKTYRRKAHVIYPPVDTDAFSLQEEKEDYYVTMSRLVAYKRVDLVVEAFSQMPDKELVVIGDGPEYDAIEAKAGPNVTMLGYQPDEAVRHYMQRARAFVFAGEEDFGITPVEAQACGTPVIAYGTGGVVETTVPGETGLLFDRQEPESIIAAVRRFEQSSMRFEPARIRRHAEQFSTERFRRELKSFVEQKYTEFRGEAVDPVYEIYS